jgi:16S rRNA C967 or C1407 C5-methylase (RsmB/RsmF family)/NOL1/NOP2/fmu family ribosome biogenesis protein
MQDENNTIAEEFFNALPLRDDVALFKACLGQEPPVSIRYNAKKTIQFEGEQIPWCQTGRYLKQRPVFTLDPLLHAGCYYVQEASSMFLEQAIKQTGLAQQPIRALDACAAPGGKSTHLLSLLHSDSLLIANETIKSRQAALIENLVKWGYNNVLVTMNDVKVIGNVQHYFDLIVCDAPCSGEGLFRKDKNAIAHWSPENVALCVLRQQRIVHDMWNALKPGGCLIYSTCTYNEQENEQNLLKFITDLDAESVSLNVSAFEGVVETITKGVYCYRFYPHRVQGEGFCIAVLRKRESQIMPLRFKHKSNASPLHAPAQKLAAGMVLQPEKSCFIEKGEEIYCLPKHAEQDYQQLKTLLNITHAGTTLGRMKQNIFIPSPELAWSLDVRKENFQCIAVDGQTALQVLKGQTQFDLKAANGYCLITYEGIPFSFLKKIEKRFNNLYPKNWYIRMRIE